MKATFNLRILWAALISLLVLFSLGNLVGIKQVWGFNFCKFLPWPIGAFATALILLAAVPAVSRKLLSWLDAISLAASEGRVPAWGWAAALCAILAPLFFLFPSTTTFLGDGTLRLNQVRNGQMLLPTEFVDYFLHAAAYRYLLKPLDISVNQCYQLFSAACGVVFIAGVFRLARYLNPAQTAATFLLIFSSGVTVLFFGYVESYSLLASLLPHIILSGLKVVDGLSSRWSFVVWFAAAALVHSISVIILAGPLAVVLWSAPSETEGTEPQLSRRLLIFGGVALAVLYAGVFLRVAAIKQYLLPVLARPDFRQGIVTTNHYLNLLNWMLLTALPFLFFAPVILRRPLRHEMFRDRRMLLAFWMAIPSLSFMFFFIPQLGGPRDWDLFSLPAFFLLVAALVIYLRGYEKPLPALVVPVTLMALITTGAFVAVNHSITRATDRYAELIEVARFKNMFREYGTLFTHAETYEEIGDRKLEFALKSWAEPPYTNADSVYILQKLVDIYTRQGNPERGAYYLNLAFRADTLNVFTHTLMVSYLNEFGTPDDLFRLAETMEKRFPRDPSTLVMIGVLFIRHGDTARGEAEMEKALALDSSDYDALVNFGTYLIGKRNFPRAIELLTKALAINHHNFLANYYAAVAYLEMGDLNRAAGFLSTAQSSTRGKQDRKMADELTAELNRRRGAAR